MSPPDTLFRRTFVQSLLVTGALTVHGAACAAFAQSDSASKYAATEKRCGFVRLPCS